MLGRRALSFDIFISIQIFGFLGFLVFPIFAIWTIGFPFLTFFLLRREKKMIDGKSNVIKSGLFYIGLKDETYYWECKISNSGKILIALIAASISEKQA